MRDRRLLVPALALAVALIVVPIVLSSSSTTTAPASSVAPGGASSGQEAPTSPAVLAEQLGVTDYRKRLDELSSKNPFRRQYTSVPKGSEAESSGQTSSATSADTVPSTATTTSHRDAIELDRHPDAFNR